MKLNALERRIIDLSYKHKLSHISSCLNTVNLLAELYAKRRDGERVILGNGHAGLALYVVLESIGLCDAEEMIEKHGVHPSRDEKHGIYCSSGSLGQAETIAVGMAMADPSKTVWLVTSDGACMEGSVYEAMRVAKRCPNLQTFIVFNGLGAYGEISGRDLPAQPNVTLCVRFGRLERFPEWLRGLPGHYLVLNDEQYQELITE